MVNEELVLDLISWLEKAAEVSDHVVVGEKLKRGLPTTSDAWMVSYGRLEEKGIIEVIFDMPVKKIAAHVGLNDDEVAEMKHLLGAAAQNGEIAVEMYMRGEGERKEDVVRLRRFHYVPRDRRNAIHEIQERMAQMILSVDDKDQGNEERRRVWEEAMKLTAERAEK